MNIPEYLALKKLTQQQFADLIGRTQGAVSQWLQGGIKVSAESAAAIEQATDGLVRREDLRPDIFAAPAKQDAAA